MGKALRHVPPGKGEPAPDPPNAWDLDAFQGPRRDEILDKLEELTEIAEFDWKFRHLKVRRNELFIELRTLGITVGRMVRAYAINRRPIITHVGVNGVLRKAGVPLDAGATTEKEED